MDNWVELKANEKAVKVIQKLRKTGDDGVLQVEGPTIELVVTCEDSSGNRGLATATPDFGSEDDGVSSDDGSSDDNSTGSDD